MPAVPFIPLIAAFAAPLLMQALGPKTGTVQQFEAVGAPAAAAPAAPQAAVVAGKQPGIAAGEPALRRQGQGQGQAQGGEAATTLMSGLSPNLGSNSLLGL